MKIRFTDTVPENIDSPVAIYWYDEKLATHPHYIDIRSLMRQNWETWSDQLQESHARIASIYSKLSRWWWVTDASRLGFLPWAGESFFKPFFFAKALKDWIAKNPSFEELIIVGYDPLLVDYLQELDRKAIIEKRRQHIRKAFGTLWEWLKPFLGNIVAIKFVIKIFYRHVLSRQPKPAEDVIIIHESINDCCEEGREFFYGNLIHVMEKLTPSSKFYCTSLRPARLNTAMSTQNRSEYLLDQISLIDLVRALISTVHLTLCLIVILVRRIPSKIGGEQKALLWRRFLLREIRPHDCFINICCYLACKKLLSKHRVHKCVLQYEEKVREKAIILACREAGVSTVGYVVHPMHRSNIALRDGYPTIMPKPDRYGLCGSAFIDYFAEWGNKSRASMTTWGSGKEIISVKSKRTIDRRTLKVLLLLSHPNELQVFRSWLEVDRRLTESVTYFARCYKTSASAAQHCKQAIQKINEASKLIIETEGTLSEDLAVCDIAIFCATSTGLLAIRSGVLCIYCDLNDFIEMNPCLDNLGAMLSCFSATDLANRFEEICHSDPEILNGLWEKQEDYASSIFSTVSESTLKEDLI